VPAGLVEQEDGVGARRHFGADLAEMRPAHAGVPQQGITRPAPLALCGADRAEDHRQRQQPQRLPGIPARLRKPPQIARPVIRPE
jgi:hypothetical protein